MYPDFVTPEAEYAKDSQLKKEDIKILQEWISKQAHLPETDEVKLIHFLNSNYYKVEAAKNCIENFYTVRAHCPEFFANRDPKSKAVQNALNTTVVTLLPTRTQEGYPILYTKVMDLSADRYDFNEQVKALDMAISLIQRQVGTSSGQVLIMDGDGYSFGHVMRSNVTSSKKHMYYVQEASPIRLKAVHVINISSVTEKFTNVLKPFIKKEVFDLVHFHKNIDTLTKFIPKEALPNEYGGSAGTLKELQAKNIKNLEDHAQYFLDEEKLIADESKRVGKSRNMNDVFGIEGTFKKLELD